MEGKRRWFGWITIGLGALALAIALLGRGFGPQLGRTAGPGTNMQQPSAQQNAQPQRGPGAHAQPSVGRQDAQPQAGPGAEVRRGGQRPGGGGFGMGGWLQGPFRLIGGSFQWAMLALLIGLGAWMLRGRNAAAAANSGRAEPAQAAPPAPLSPTGEAYTEEPSEEQ
jgi:hypothetical protein